MRKQKSNSSNFSTGTKLNILILSWEIYPIYCGGLGILVESLVKELKKQGNSITVLVPSANVVVKKSYIVNLKEKIDFYSKLDLQVTGLDFKLNTFELGDNSSNQGNKLDVYPNQTPKITRSYAYAVSDYIEKSPQKFDTILAMDWPTIPTFAHLKNIGSKIPFAFYINATELDRNYGAKTLYYASEKIIDLEKRYFNQADLLFTISSICKENLVKYYNCPEAKIKIVLNDLNFYPKANKVQREPKQVLFLGRFAYQKGLEYLLESAVKVIKKDPEIQFRIVGNGSLEFELRNYIKKNKLHNNVHILEWVEKKAKEKIYAASKLFLMPSVSEPFGLTALEAIRSGVPVISSNRCGFTDVVPSTPTFDYYDTSAQADMIHHLLHSEFHWNDLIENQTNELSKHNWGTQVKNLLNHISLHLNSSL